MMSLLAALPRATVATHDEALGFLDTKIHAGAGIGWIDVHLLASAALTGVHLWTLDTRLRKVSKTLGVMWRP
jgi:hypothetical protein